MVLNWVSDMSMTFQEVREKARGQGDLENELPRHYSPLTATESNGGESLCLGILRVCKAVLVQAGKPCALRWVALIM